MCIWASRRACKSDRISTNQLYLFLLLYRSAPAKCLGTLSKESSTRELNFEFVRTSDERSNDSNRSGQNPHQHHHRSYLQPKRPSNVVKRCCSTSEEEKQSFVSHVGTVTGVAVNDRYNVLNMPASTGTAFRKLNERGENLTRILINKITENGND